MKITELMDVYGIAEEDFNISSDVDEEYFVNEEGIKRKGDSNAEHR